MTDRRGRDDHPLTGAHETADVPHTGPSGYDALLAGHADDARVSDPHEEIFGAGAPDDRPRRKAGRGKRLAILGLALALVLGGIGFVGLTFAPTVMDMLAGKDYEGPGSGEATVVVHEGDTGQAIARTLVDAGVVKTTEAFTKALSEQRGDEIQPGTYVLKQQMKASDALSALRGGGTRQQHTVVIREGLRASEIYEALSKGTGVPVAEYAKAARNPRALGVPAAAGNSIEGFLFPATYTFGPKATATDQLKELVGQAEARHSALGIEPKDVHRIVTIASIVEAEARLPQDRPKVAAVIENRLARPMRLQLDSTVVYGIGKRVITTTDAERNDASNRYNTYMHDGLPPGPINNPGEDSLKATIDPAKGDWLYFVAVNPETGETLYASTLAEHNRNVLKFQAWCQAHPGKC